MIGQPSTIDNNSSNESLNQLKINHPGPVGNNSFARISFAQQRLDAFKQSAQEPVAPIAHGTVSATERSKVVRTVASFGVNKSLAQQRLESFKIATVEPIDIETNPQESTPSSSTLQIDVKNAPEQQQTRTVGKSSVVVEKSLAQQRLESFKVATIEPMEMKTDSWQITQSPPLIGVEDVPIKDTRFRSIDCNRATVAERPPQQQRRLNQHKKSLTQQRLESFKVTNIEPMDMETTDTREITSCVKENRAQRPSQQQRRLDSSALSMIRRHLQQQPRIMDKASADDPVQSNIIEAANQTKETKFDWLSECEEHERNSM